MTGKLLNEKDIMEFVSKGVKEYNLMTPKCFDTLVVKGDLSNMECVTAFTSKVLGLGIVMGSSLVKLPQVLKIVFGGSAEGISFLSVFLELLAITLSGLYSFANKFPFSAYGESVFLAVQTALIAVMVLWFSRGKVASLVFICLYSGLVYLGMDSKLVPLSVLWYGQAVNIPMIVVGKFMQIIANYSNGHTGQLSAITTFLLALGAVARIFTSIQETGDQTIIMTYIVSSTVNSLIALQVLWYWSATNAALAKKKKE